MTDWEARQTLALLAGVHTRIPRLTKHVEAKMCGRWPQSAQESRQSQDLIEVLGRLDHFAVALHRLLTHPAATRIIGSGEQDEDATPDVHSLLDRAARVKVMHDGTDDSADTDQGPPPLGAA